MLPICKMISCTEKKSYNIIPKQILYPALYSAIYSIKNVLTLFLLCKELVLKYLQKTSNGKFYFKM